MERALTEACERLAEAMALEDSRRKAQAYAIRKGRTLYIVSSEARELRRLDTIYAEAK